MRLERFHRIISTEIPTIIFVSMSIPETQPLPNNMQSLVETTKAHLQKISEGGGKKAIAKQKEKNKLTPRERIDYLIDRDSEFIEIGAFAGFEMYEEQERLQ